MLHAFRVAKLGDMAGYTTILAGNSVRFMVSLAGFYSQIAGRRKTQLCHVGFTSYWQHMPEKCFNF